MKTLGLIFDLFIGTAALALAFVPPHDFMITALMLVTAALFYSRFFEALNK